MVVEKGIVLGLRLSEQMQQDIGRAAGRTGLTALDWTRAVLARAANEGAYAPKKGLGAESAKKYSVRITEQLNDMVNAAVNKSGFDTQDWLRAVLARAANEGAFAPRKGDKHARPKRKPA